MCGDGGGGGARRGDVGARRGSVGLDGTADGLVRLPRDALALDGAEEGGLASAAPKELGGPGGLGRGRAAVLACFSGRGAVHGERGDAGASRDARRRMRRRRARNTAAATRTVTPSMTNAVDLGETRRTRVTAGEARARVARRHAARRRLPGRPSPRGRHRPTRPDPTTRRRGHRSSGPSSRRPHRPRRREGAPVAAPPSPKTSSRAVRIAVSRVFRAPGRVARGGVAPRVMRFLVAPESEAFSVSSRPRPTRLVLTSARRKRQSAVVVDRATASAPRRRG